MKSCDVAIVGGGIVGLSIAWQIARRSKLKVVVLEKGAGVGEGSTGASSAICRCLYSVDEMLALARDSIECYRHWPQFTGLAEPCASLNADGVLWMPGDDPGWAAAAHARMQRFDVASEILDDADLAERYPSLSPCVLPPDLETGQDHDCRGGGQHLLETGGGWVDPVLAAQDLVEACRGAGVQVRFRSRVRALEVDAGEIRGLTLDDGEAIACPVVVNAAGPWCRDLHAMAGLDLPWDLAPVRIQVLYRDWPADLGRIPVVGDLAGGIYFRPQNRGQQLVVSTLLPEDEREEVADPDAFQATHDQDFELAKLHALHHRIPDLPSRGQIRGYCGMYTMNRDDVHPIVGPTKIYGLWLANGFSGHGFKLAPAIGAMVAQGITGTILDDDSRVSSSLFAVDREPIDIGVKSVLA